jgi:hypothetical protein
MAFKPSNAPVDENAQHPPHEPWFLTAVTAPFCVQSTASSKGAVNSTGTVDGAGDFFWLIVKQLIFSPNY